jgi:hypothetical protein
VVAPLTSLGAAAFRPGRRLAGLAVGQAQRVLAEPARDAVLFGVDAALLAADDVLRSALAHEVLARIAGSSVVDDALHQLTQTIDSPEAGRLVAGTVNGADVERLVGRVIDSPLLDVAVTRAIDSRLLDLVVARLLDSDALWFMIDEIAQSPAVTAAISRQSVSFANQVAGGARDRSRTADARLERLAARLTRRAPRGEPRPSGQPAPEA